MPVLAIAKFLVPIPAWVIAAYLVVAGAMTALLLVQFLRNARTRNASANAWLVLLILMFPLAALSMVWPITLPFALRVMWKDRQAGTRRSRGSALDSNTLEEDDRSDRRCTTNGCAFPLSKTAAFCPRCGKKVSLGMVPNT